jgi:hypothetical protein
MNSYKEYNGLPVLHWKKDHKYYEATFVKNLLGEIDLILAWGSYASNRGNTKVIPISSMQEMYQQLQYVIKRRASRGYTRVS